MPFVPGGAVDAVGRLLGNAMTAALGQPVVIENRGGAGGVIGMEASAHAAPDGYTMMVSHSGFAAMQGLYRKLPFDPVRDFEGIITAVSGIYVLVVNPALPFRSVAELIVYAKANPGKLSYASAGVGSTVHLAGEFFKHAAAIDIVHVPYKGSGPATTDLVGGQVADDVRPRGQHFAAGAGRQAAGAGGDLGQALGARPRSADHRGKRPAGLRRGGLVRAGGAGRDSRSPPSPGSTPPPTACSSRPT